MGLSEAAIKQLNHEELVGLSAQDIKSLDRDALDALLDRAEHLTPSQNIVALTQINKIERASRLAAEARSKAVEARSKAVEARSKAVEARSKAVEAERDQERASRLSAEAERDAAREERDERPEIHFAWDVLGKALAKSRNFEVIETLSTSKPTGQRTNHIPPESVSKWDDFDDEILSVALNEEGVKACRTIAFDQIDMAARYKEASAKGIMRPFLGFLEVLLKNHKPWSEDSIRISDELITPTGSQADIVWFCDDNLEARERSSSTQSSSGTLSLRGMRPFLIQEHKAPVSFPVQLQEKLKEEERGGSDSVQDRRLAVEYAKYQSDLCDSDSACLVAFYDQFKVVKNAVGQLFEYMLTLDLRYGVLSTTDRTWFCKRDSNGEMWISRCFMCTGEEDDSVCRAMFAFLVVAHRNPLESISSEYENRLKVKLKPRGPASSVTYTVSRQLGSIWSSVPARRSERRDRRGNGEATAESIAESTKIKELIKILPMSEDQFGMPLWTHSSYKTIWEGNQTHVARMTMAEDLNTQMVVKSLTRGGWHDDEIRAGMRMFEKERDLYTGPLRPLQGTVVPFLLYGGLFWPGRYIIALSDEGESLARLDRSDLDWGQMHQSFRHALSAVHAAGVLHGDIHPRNLVWNKQAEEARIIDFGRAELVSNPESKQNKERFETEMAVLDAIFCD